MAIASAADYVQAIAPLTLLKSETANPYGLRTNVPCALAACIAARNLQYKEAPKQPYTDNICMNKDLGKNRGLFALNLHNTKRIKD